MNLSIRASSLDTYLKCPRKFAAHWLIDKGLADDYGFTFNATRQHVGSVVGSAAHEGVAYLARQYKESGTHGGLKRAKNAASVAAAYVAKASNHGMVTDSVTKSVRDAVKAAGQIVMDHHELIVPDSFPSIIEGPLSCSFVQPISGMDYEVTGTLDAYFTERTLRDLKTSTKWPIAYAQQGTYVDLLEANGRPVHKAFIDWFPRRKPGMAPNNGSSIEISITEAKEHSRTVHSSAALALEGMVMSGSQNEIIANPGNDLCSSKLCPAFGTSFCRLGALANPTR